MSHSLVRLVLAAALASALPALAIAQAAGVTTDLKAYRIVPVEGGGERREAADRARPGEVIEYAAEYRNGLDHAVRDLRPLLPIPAGMEYLAATARPAAVEASLDGAKFEPVPLRRTVRQADGTEKSVEVPPAEYRYLRWHVPELAAGASVTVTARARITPAGR